MLSFLEHPKGIPVLRWIW